MEIFEKALILFPFNFNLIIDAVNIRGCLADQSASNQAVCNSDSFVCKTCGDKNCNTDNVRGDEMCFSCDSAIDKNCAQKPQNLISKHCLVASNGECFTRISSKLLINLIKIEIY
jgi:hypothetical protein